MRVEVGIIGFGVIGTGVVHLLQQHSEMLRMRTGIEIIIKKIVDIDIERDRGVAVEKSILSTNIDDVLTDDEIEVVIELVGGTTIAYDIVERAITNGKHVVTANKALLYEHGETLFRLAVEHKREIRYEASVCGGIPIIKVLTESLAGDKVSAIYGIVNGTTNYILTKMICEHWQFSDALKKAQELGFAEADPTLDINGGDATHKLAILANVAFNATVDKRNVYSEGIEHIELKDVLYAQELGYVVKLLAIAKQKNGAMELRVHPTLIPTTSNLANVSNEFNAVMLESDFLGVSHYVGKGAGSHPTASAVVGDIVDLMMLLKGKHEYNPKRYLPFNTYRTMRYTEFTSRYYLRVTTVEEVGILADITKVLADNNISISAVIQKEVTTERPVPIIILTHEAREEDMRAAIKEIDSRDITKEKTVVMRLEDLG